MSQLDDFNRRMTLGDAAGYSHDIGTQMAYGAADSFRNHQQRMPSSGGGPVGTYYVKSGDFAKAFALFAAGLGMLILSIYLIEDVKGWGVPGFVVGLLGFLASAFGFLFLVITVIGNLKTILRSRYFWASAGLAVLTGMLVGAMPGLFGYGVSPLGAGVTVLMYAFFISGFVAIARALMGAVWKPSVTQAADKN
ncbi:MAG: hypothetical protein ACK4NR_10700 [Micavibrio sp.]